MSKPLSFCQVLGTRALNSQWESCGPHGEPPLMGEEKNQICGAFTAKLKKSFEKNGDDFLSEVWTVLKPALATQNWYAKSPKGEYWLFIKGGVYILCNSMYARASRLAEQRIKLRPKPIGPIMKEVSKELLNNALEKSGVNEAFT